jgi:translation elongation factor P/translation initiation factor 5A
MVSAKEIGTGDFFKIKNEIYSVVRKGIVNVGTHCHTKVRMSVQNLNGGGEKEMVYSHEDKLDSIDVKRSKGQVVLKKEDGVQVMDLFNYETFDAEADEELLPVLTEGDTVSYVEFEGRRRVTSKLRSA